MTGAGAAVHNGTARRAAPRYDCGMPSDSDVSTQIRTFLVKHPGSCCEPCLAKGTRLDAKAVKAAFKPSKDNPYSFMPACCTHCEKTAMCVAYVGELKQVTGQQAAIALMGSKH
jgi:hypothetical protein